MLTFTNILPNENTEKFEDSDVGKASIEKNGKGKSKQTC